MLRWKDKKLDELNKVKIFRNWSAYAVLLVALGAMTFFGVCTPKGSNGVYGPQGAAASVGRDEISAREFRRAYQNAYTRLQRQYSEAFDPAMMRLSQNVMQQLVDERIAYQVAVESGMKASDDEIMKMLSDAKAFEDDKGKFSDELMQNYLRSNGYTEASFLEEMRRSLTVQKFRQFVGATSYASTKEAELDYKVSETKFDIEYLKLDPQVITSVVTIEEVKVFLNEEGKAKVKDYYERNKGEFNVPSKVRARHILVAFKGARNASAESEKRTKEEAKKRADEIAAKAATSGVDFAKLATEMTDEQAGKAKGGDLGFFSRETMVKEFSEVAFSLKPGQVSAAVESPFGFHIIKVEAITPEKNETLEAATETIARKLIEKERKPKILEEKSQAILTALKGGQPIDSLMKELGVEWKSTGDVAVNAKFYPGLGGEQSVKEAAMSLNPNHRLYDNIVDVRGSKYILRLKNFKPANMDQFTAEKKEQLSQTDAFSQGFEIFSAITKDVKESYEKKGRIWMNPDYLDLDQKRQANSSNGENEG